LPTVMAILVLNSPEGPHQSWARPTPPTRAGRGYSRGGWPA
jgi:hypothetical protein